MDCPKCSIEMRIEKLEYEETERGRVRVQTLVCPRCAHIIERRREMPETGTTKDGGNS